MKIQLEIEPVFERLTIPYDTIEMEMLEQSILEEGCLKPIIVWNGMIIDGHKRYEICSYEEIDYKIEEMNFLSKEDAIIWVCRQRAPILDKKSMAYRYLVGKWYRCSVLLHREGKDFLRGIEAKEKEDKHIDTTRAYRSSNWIADELGLFHTTVESNGSISIAMDEIAEKDRKMFKILMGNSSKFTRQRIKEMSHWSVKRLYEERRKMKLETKHQNPRMENKELNQCEQKKLTMKPEVPIVVGIKEMPKFDPDMELRGLALTIPTWINAMQRAQSKTDMSLVSDEMKKQLRNTLQRFLAQINQTMEGLEL